MAKLTRAHRETIAHRRIVSVLKSHGTANARTLEQKISDAGPNPVRVDPHILTAVRNQMIADGRVVRTNQGSTNWFHLPETPPHVVERRLEEQLPVLRALYNGKLRVRIGQTLEIATYRALLKLEDGFFFGRFIDIDEHDDSTAYAKEEPPQHIGRLQLPGRQNLDFIYIHPTAGVFGIECKNVREWLYPSQVEIIETISKCISIDAVPVIIARRIPYVTFYLLSSCGVITYQHFNQLMPEAERSLADIAKHKNNLGYHDIRVGNLPDKRLLKLITENLPDIAVEARAKSDDYKDILTDYSRQIISDREFAHQVICRRKGISEHHRFEGDVADWDL